MGFSDSETKAWSTWLSIGRLSMPASFSTRPVLPAAATATFLARMSPRVVFTPTMRSPSLRKPITSQFFNDVDAAPVGAARVAPGDSVVASRAGARLQQAADHRKARLGRHVEAGIEAGRSGRGQQFRVAAFVAHGVAAPRIVVELARAYGRGSECRAART